MCGCLAEWVGMEGLHLFTFKTVDIFLKNKLCVEICLVHASLGKTVGVVTKLALENKMNRLSVFAGTAKVITLATKEVSCKEESLFQTLKAGITFWKLPVGCFQWCRWTASVKSAQLNWVSHHAVNSKVLQRLSKLMCAGFIFQESQSLHAALGELNNTVVAYQKLNDVKLLNVDSAIGNLSQRVMLLENSTLSGNNLDKRENLSTSVVSI